MGFLDRGHVLLCNALSRGDLGARRLGGMGLVRLEFCRALDSIRVRSLMLWWFLAVRFRISCGKERSDWFSAPAAATCETTSQEAVDFAHFISDYLRTFGADLEPPSSNIDERLCCLICC